MGRNDKLSNQLAIAPQHHFGLIVGINSYPAIGDLEGPVSDSEAFHDWLTSAGGGGVPEGNIIHIRSPSTSATLNPVDARPSRHDVEKALYNLNEMTEALCSNRPSVWPYTRLYIYVAGHGVMPGNGDTALLLADSRPGWYENIELSNYIRYYQMAGIYREVVVFADCCRKWYSRIRASIVPFDSPPRPQTEVFTLVGYASAPDRPSYEGNQNPDEVRGYFTRALLDGLQGGASWDRDYQAISSTTLGRHVAVSVANSTAHLPHPQSVHMQYSAAHPILFPLKSTGLTGMVAVSILFPPDWRYPVDLLHPNRTRTGYAPTSDEWNLLLPEGIYAVVNPGSYSSPFRHDGAFIATGESRAIQL